MLRCLEHVIQGVLPTCAIARALSEWSARAQRRLSKSYHVHPKLDAPLNVDIVVPYSDNMGITMRQRRSLHKVDKQFTI